MLTPECCCCFCWHSWTSPIGRSFMTTMVSILVYRNINNKAAGYCRRCMKRRLKKKSGGKRCQKWSSVSGVLLCCLFVCLFVCVFSRCWGLELQVGGRTKRDI